MWNLPCFTQIEALLIKSLSLSGFPDADFLPSPWTFKVQILYIIFGGGVYLRVVLLGRGLLTRNVYERVGLPLLT